MASLVQQSTTQLALKFFLVLSSDHISPATGLSGSVTVTICKEGGAFGSPAGAISEIANGWYQVAPNATDTNTLGEILLHAAVATADNCDMIAAEVVAFNPQNANLGLSHVSANVDRWNGHVVTDTTSGVPDVNTMNYNNQTAVTDGNNLPSVNVVDVNGAAVIETGLTMLQAMRLIASTTGAKLSGAGTGTEVFRNAVADSANRVTATVDSSGNRTAIVYSL